MCSFPQWAAYATQTQGVPLEDQLNHLVCCSIPEYCQHVLLSDPCTGGGGRGRKQYELYPPTPISHHAF